MSAIRAGRSGKRRGFACPPTRAVTTTRTRWPEDKPLDPNACEQALWEAKGNIQTAAALMGTDAARLGYLISKDEALAQTRAKAADLVLDKAEGRVVAAIDDEEHGLEIAKWVLTNGGKARGWGQSAPTPLGLTFGAALPGSGAIAIRWQVEEPHAPPTA